ncbi:MAG TPA: outer membrane beta-barrel protein [Balneolaceae bacterium]
MRKLLLLLLLVFIFSPSLVQAQDYDESAFSIGPRLGYYKAENANEGTFYYGLQARIRFNEVLGIEGSVSYRPGTESSFAGQSFETKFVPVTGSLMLFLPIDGFTPYGIAGIGAYYTIYDSEGPISDNWESQFDFGYHLGFGAELAFSDDVALSLDYRYLFLTPEGENAPEDADFSGNVFTAGLMFYL